MHAFVPYYAMERLKGMKILVTVENRLECANSVKFIRLDEKVSAADLKIAEKAAKDAPQKALTGRAKRQERMNRAKEIAANNGKLPANLRPPTRAGEVVDIVDPSVETVPDPAPDPVPKPAAPTAEQKAAQAAARKAAREKKAAARKESAAREKAAKAEAKKAEEGAE